MIYTAYRCYLPREGDCEYSTLKFGENFCLTSGFESGTFTVYKDGETLSETEKSDFESYLLQTLPPNLFRFYFFDGEKISDFVFNSSKNSDFKDAFLKLCSLDTMEIIRENFRRISRSKAKGAMTLSAEYDRCLEADNLIAQRVECAEDEYREISNEILIIDQRLASLEKAYAKGGGISKKEWRSMQDQIAKEDVRREGHHKWLKELANNVLPFIILRTQLEELKSQIALEHKAQVDANVKSTIDTPEIKSIISGVLSRANIELADDISEKVIYEIASYASHTSQITPILNLSDFDRFELTAKINSLLAYDTNRVKEATDDIKASLKCVKRIRKKMERSSIENYDGYLQMKSDLNEQKSKCTQQLLEVDKELQELRAQKAISASKLSKAKSDYEALLKKQSINDISARALLAFDELQKTLYDKSIRLVETGFSQFFASLINKSDLIDGIHIDDSLNVLPYKNKHFKADEIRKIIGKNGVEYLIVLVVIIAKKIKDKYYNKRLKKARVAYLKRIDGNKVELIRYLLNESTHTAMLPMHDGVVLELQHFYVILPAGSTHAVNMADPQINYFLQPWVIEEIDGDPELKAKFGR